MKKLKRKYFAIPRAAGAADEGIFITTPDPDLEGDRVMPEGADLSGYLANPIVLWLHDSYGISASAGIPIGTSRSLEIIAGKGIRATAIDWLEGDPFVDRVRNAWEQGKIRAASIGFIPLQDGWKPNDFGGFDFTKWRLLEWSMCPVPCNPAAVRSAKDGAALAGIIKALGGEAGLIPGVEPEPDPVTVKIVPVPDHAVQFRAHDARIAALEAKVAAPAPAPQPTPPAPVDIAAAVREAATAAGVGR